MLNKKLIRPVLTVASVALLSACGGTDSLNEFDVNEAISEVQVQGSAVSGALPEQFAPISLDVMELESFNSEDYDFLKSIQIEKLNLTITSRSNDSVADTLEDGQADNFNFLSAARVYVRASIGGAERQALVAELNADDPQLTAGSANISLNPTRVDILAITEAADGYQMIIEPSGTPPPDAVFFDGSIEYSVGFGIR